MITLKGKYNEAIVLIDENDAETISQIYSFLNHPAFAHTYIAIMPDCHAGAGAVIGFTAKLNDYIIPNVVGVDIGCGIDGYILEGVDNINFEKLDTFIRKNIPSGFSSQAKVLNRNWEKFESYRTWVSDIQLTAEATGQSFDYVHLQFQTLGGGNHFIEIVRNDSSYWLVVHTGSRNFGLKVATYHQNKAKELMRKMFVGADAYKTLEYLPMDMGGSIYIDDMVIAQHYASINRELIASKIVNDFFGIKVGETIKSTHNYISMDDNIIRKGATSAYEGQKILIPLNMRDGILFCTGKGNKKWNYSAPHGAGRILSRRKAKETLDIKEFEETMKGVWSSCISQDTLDESPMAYKNGNVIAELIDETASIDFTAKPVYNFKAS